jgi:uncharacterized protein YcfJ
MKFFSKQAVLSAFVLSISLSVLGCQNLNHTENGALLGSGLGAIAGAVIGHQTGHRDTGALIGAAVGGVGGGAIGSQKDTEVAQAQYQAQVTHTKDRAVTNQDVIEMIRRGRSEALILSTIEERGGWFDTSPQAINTLSENGVSDSVIMVMQRQNQVR